MWVGNVSMDFPMIGGFLRFFEIFWDFWEVAQRFERYWRIGRTDFEILYGLHVYLFIVKFANIKIIINYII